MPHNHEWHSRIKAVEREYVAMRQAADHFLQAARADPTILLENVLHREIMRASQRLEGTYIVRLFAEFETGAAFLLGQRAVVGKAIWPTLKAHLDFV